MASLTRSTQGAGLWQARYRTPDGRHVTRRFTRKIDGQRWLDEAAAAVVTGQYVHPSAGRVSVRAYAESWRVIQAHRPTTALHVETMLRRHVYPTLGHRPLDSVRPSDVQAWVKGLSAVLAPSTVSVVHRLVSGIFRAAVADRKIASSPCAGTRLPRREQVRVEPLTTEVVMALQDAVPARYAALVALAAGTGMRQGEVFGLTLDRVDFLRRRVVVDRQLILIPGSEPRMGPPKTPASVRTIPLPDVVLTALAEHVATYAVDPDALIFTAEDGRAIRRTRFSDVWRAAAATAGTTGGMHALRHYYASLLIRHGESVKTVQARLGHASASETLDTYAHLWPDSEDRTRQAVDAVLGALADGAAYTARTGQAPAGALPSVAADVRRSQPVRRGPAGGA